MNDLQKQQSPKILEKEMLLPFILVAILFPLWGFANDVTNPLVRAFKDIFLISNATQVYSNCRVPQSAMLGEIHKGFDVANSWLGATRLQVAATCLGRAERAFNLAVQYAADRQQFGQAIGKFQGVSFKLADMATEMKAAELLVMEAGWKYDQGTCTDADMAMAKLKATEMLAMVADEAIQIFGGMGLMNELPLERIWRDARIERIWEGTSEIQRHIISRSLLRPLGA